MILKNSLLAFILLACATVDAADNKNDATTPSNSVENKKETKKRRKTKKNQGRKTGSQHHQNATASNSASNSADENPAEGDVTFDSADVTALLENSDTTTKTSLGKLPPEELAAQMEEAETEVKNLLDTTGINTTTIGLHSVPPVATVVTPRDRGIISALPIEAAAATEDKPVTGPQQKTNAQRMASFAGHAKDEVDALVKEDTENFAKAGGHYLKAIAKKSDVSTDTKPTTAELTALAGQVAAASASLASATDALAALNEEENVTFSLFDTNFDTGNQAPAEKAPEPTMIEVTPENSPTTAQKLVEEARETLKKSMHLPWGVTYEAPFNQVNGDSTKHTYTGFPMTAYVDKSEKDRHCANYDVIITLDARKRAAVFAATAVGVTYLALLAYGYKVHNNFMPGQTWVNNAFEGSVQRIANCSPKMSFLSNLLRAPLTTATKALPQKTFEVTTNTLTSFGKMLPKTFVNLFVNSTTKTVVLG